MVNRGEEKVRVHMNVVFEVLLTKPASFVSSKTLSEKGLGEYG